MEEEERRKVEEKKRKLDQKRLNLPTEPSRETANVFLAFKLPSGTRLQRRFEPKALVQTLYDFVDTQQEEVPMDEYDLVIPHPKRLLSEVDLSLSEVGIQSNTVILVQRR